MHTLHDVIRPRDIYWVESSDTVRQAIRYMCERKTGAVAVKEGGEVVGVFSERDLMHRVVDEGRDPDAVTMREVMSRSLHTVLLDEEIHRAKAMMQQAGTRHLVVVGRNGGFKGLVSIRDLMEADLADSAALVSKLNDSYYEKAYRARWRTSSNRVIVEPYVQRQA